MSNVIKLFKPSSDRVNYLRAWFFRQIGDIKNPTTALFAVRCTEGCTIETECLAIEPEHAAQMIPEIRKTLIELERFVARSGVNLPRDEQERFKGAPNVVALRTIIL